MLTEIHIKPGYNTLDDNVGSDFYNPVLNESENYDRLSCYFSGKALAYFSKGLVSLAKRHGHYRLIISNEISREDYDNISEGYRVRKFAQQMHDSLQNDTHDLYDEMCISNLAFLIANGTADVKIGFTTDGLFHAKYGIMTDRQGNAVYFAGSFNETASAFAHNYENIDVKKTWDGVETDEYIKKQQYDFNQLWLEKNQDGTLFVKSINDILYKEIAEFNKGRLVMEPKLITTNALVLHYHDNHFQIQNNLRNKISDGLYTLKKIQHQYLTNEQEWELRQNISYVEVEKNLIPALERLSQKNNFKFVVADSALDFIESSKFELSKIYKQGLAIKNENPEYLNSFDEFNRVVNSQVARSLRPAQAWVSFYMMMMQRVGNFSVPGSGKTAMVYGTYAYLSALGISKIDKIVVIGPKSSFLAWKTEFREVFGDKRELRVLDVQDANFRPEQFSKNTGQYNLILVNYEALPRYSADLEKLINHKTLLVFDEVHKLKGIKSQRPKFAFPLANKASYKLALTGTPIPNGYQDIYNMLNLLYKYEYADYFGFTTSELTSPTPDIVEEINEKLYPFFWRVTKKELQVPPAEPDIIKKCEATHEERDVIDMLWSKYGSMPFKLYIRLMQVSSNPDLLKRKIDESIFGDKNENDDDDVNVTLSDYNKNMEDVPEYSEKQIELINRLSKSTKFEAALAKTIQLIESGHIPVVWAIFVDTIDKFSARVEKAGYRVAKVYGAVSAQDRERIIRDFQDNKYDMLISNPHTLAESVSLHHVSHDAVYLEYSFNLTHMLQSRDRIHRLGLKPGTKTRYYYFELVSQNTHRQPIDETIYNRLAEKRDLMLQAIEGEKLQPEFTGDDYNEIREMMHKFMGDSEK